MISRIFGRKKPDKLSDQITEQPPADEPVIIPDDQAVTELALAQGLLPNDRWQVRGSHAVCIGSRVHILPLGR